MINDWRIEDPESWVMCSPKDAPYWDFFANFDRDKSNDYHSEILKRYKYGDMHIANAIHPDSPMLSDSESPGPRSPSQTLPTLKDTHKTLKPWTPAELEEIRKNGIVFDFKSEKGVCSDSRSSISSTSLESFISDTPPFDPGDLELVELIRRKILEEEGKD